MDRDPECGCPRILGVRLGWWLLALALLGLYVAKRGAKAGPALGALGAAASLL